MISTFPFKSNRNGILEEESRKLPLSKVFTKFFVRELSRSERALEVDHDFIGNRALECLFRDVRRAEELLSNVDGKTINKSPKLVKFVSKQLGGFRKNLTKFKKASDKGNARKACLFSRKVRNAIELLMAIHPRLVKEELASVVDELEQGWRILGVRGNMREAYLDNIEKRFVSLCLTAEAFAKLDFELVSPEKFEAAVRDIASQKLREQSTAVKEKTEILQELASLNETLLENTPNSAIEFRSVDQG